MTHDPKPKRGRPRAFALDDPLYAMQGEPASHRSKQHSAYLRQALHILGIAEEGANPFPHIYDRASEAPHRRGAIKRRVLYELGRVANEFGDTAARDLAGKVEQAFASGDLVRVADAADWLRAVRLQLAGREGRRQP